MLRRRAPRRKVAIFALVLTSTVPTPVAAYPEGAPWGASNPDAEQNCASCHFDYDAVRGSAALTIEGLPERPEPGKRYALTIRFDDPAQEIAGFQMIAIADPGSAGRFVSTMPNIEYVGAAIRSTDPISNDSGAAWQLEWTAPDSAGAVITFFLAVTGSNDDGSPFGDQIHFRSFELEM